MPILAVKWSLPNATLIHFNGATCISTVEVLMWKEPAKKSCPGKETGISSNLQCDIIRQGAVMANQIPSIWGRLLCTSPTIYQSHSMICAVFCCLINILPMPPLTFLAWTPSKRRGTVPDLYKNAFWNSAVSQCQWISTKVLVFYAQNSLLNGVSPPLNLNISDFWSFILASAELEGPYTRSNFGLSHMKDSLLSSVHTGRPLWDRSVVRVQWSSIKSFGAWRLEPDKGVGMFEMKKFVRRVTRQHLRANMFKAVPDKHSHRWGEKPGVTDMNETG